jgi:hypothetical protein
MRAVKARARLAFIATDGKVDFATLEAAAAKAIVAEERAKPRATAYAAPNSGNITVANAREVFIARVQAVAARLAAPITPSVRPKGVTELAFKPRPLTRKRQVEGKPEPAPASTTAPAPEPTLIFTGRGTAAELIGDDQFHTSVIDLTTQAWRRSIEENERRVAEQLRRRSLWVG